MSPYQIVSLALVLATLFGAKPAPCLCSDLGFNVNIKASNETGTSSVSVDGYVMHVITDDETKFYRLDGDKLASAVKMYFGRRPDSVFLKSPAIVQGMDMYQLEGWTEVSTLINATNTRVLDVTSQIEVVKTALYENKFSHNTTYSTAISQQEQYSATSSWNVGGTSTVTEKVTVSVGFMGTGGKLETDMSYSQSWGIGSSHTKGVTLGSTDGASGVLQPGEKVKIVLSASRGTMTLSVDYVTQLVGSVIVSYNPPYYGHYIWRLQVDDMMKNIGLKNSFQSSEVIKIQYFTNAHVTVMNGNTNEILSVHPISTVDLNI